MREPNPEQRAAATLGDGPALVLAGPGTGKTTTLVARFVHLVRRGVAPNRILATTFTRVAAREIDVRVRDVMGKAGMPAPAVLDIGTFHSRCRLWLRADPAAFDVPPRFGVVGAGQQFTILRALGLDGDLDLDALELRISRFKDALTTPAEAMRAARLSRDTEERDIAWAYGEYQKELDKRGMLDFGDMIGAVVRGLRRDALRTRIAGQFDHLLVDEVQDINLAQHELIRALAKDHGNVWAVGDDDQAIYGWRGSDVRFLVNFERTWPGARIVRLRLNYRSPPATVAGALAIITPNPGRLAKPLEAVKTSPIPVVLVHAKSAEREAEWVARSVRTALDMGARPRDLAVLVRTGAQMVHFEGALQRVDVAYELRGGRSFWTLPEVRNVEDGLRAVFGLPDSSYRPVPQWLREKVEPLASSWAAAGLQKAARSVAALVASSPPRAMRRERRVQWRAAALEAAQVAGGFDDAGGFLRYAEVQRRQRGVERRDDAVVVSTIHQAKGLEWDTVFAAGFEAGLLPLADAEDPEEERRLAYVAVTRAARVLAISYAEERDGTESGASPYIADFTGGLNADAGQLGRRTWPEGWTPPPPPRRPPPLAPRPGRPGSGSRSTNREAPPPSAANQRVFHARFGGGTVVVRRGKKVTVEFDDGTVRRVLESFLLDAPDE